MDLFSTLQLLHEAVMSVLVTTIYGRWRGTITVHEWVIFCDVVLMFLIMICAFMVFGSFGILPNKPM